MHSHRSHHHVSRRISRPRGLFKLSNEELILILEYLDPESLWKFSQTSRKIYTIVQCVQSLLYKFKLGLSGMKDGPPRHSSGPPLKRLQLISHYHTNWSTLSWAREDAVQMPASSVSMGVSGGCLYNVMANGVHQPFKINIWQLPSYRTGTATKSLGRFRYESPSALRDVVIDPLQDLLIATRFLSVPHAPIQFELDFHSLSTFQVHPHAPSLTYRFDTRLVDPGLYCAPEVYKNKIAVALRSQNIHKGETANLLLLDWMSHKAHMWPGVLDFQLLSSSLILIVHRDTSSRTPGSPIIRLWDVRRIESPFALRQFELPSFCINSRIRFSSNSSPRTDQDATKGTLFFPDPSGRILVLEISTCVGMAARTILVVPELFFRSPTRSASHTVPWAQWSAYCFLRAMSATETLASTCAGRRLMLLETPVGSRVPLIRLIHFRTLPDRNVKPRCAVGWTWIGERTSMSPVESTRRVESEELPGLRIDALSPTDDNIVQFMDGPQGLKAVSILTFT